LSGPPQINGCNLTAGRFVCHITESDSGMFRMSEIVLALYVKSYMLMFQNALSKKPSKTLGRSVIKFYITEQLLE